MLSFVREDDTVVVHSMDRLARNLDDRKQWDGLLLIPFGADAPRWGRTSSRVTSRHFAAGKPN